MNVKTWTWISVNKTLFGWWKVSIRNWVPGLIVPNPSRGLAKFANKADAEDYARAQRIRRNI